MHSNALVTNRRKRNTRKKSQRITEQCSGASICENVVCRAMISGPNNFCTRCSCCICKDFDGDGKDPSLWLECAPDSPVRSCGLSCHIKCALEDGRVGVVNICQRTRLDGGYWCFYCGNISGILGCLKKQLTLAKDTRRVALLFDRIDLCVKLLNGTRRFQDLLETVKEAKRLLDGEVISLDGSSSNMAPNLVGRLLVAAEVRKLCAAALRRVDELSATPSLQGPNLWMPDQMVFPGTSGAQSMPLQLDLNVAAEPESDAADVAPAMDDADPVCVPAVIFQAEVASTEAHEEVPDLNEDVAPFHDSSMGNTDPGCDVSENRALHEEVPAVNVQAEVERERPVSRDDLNVVAAPVKDSSMENTDLGCDVSVTLPAVNVQAEVESVRPARPEVPGNLDGNYEYCMGVIRGLEVGGYITSEDRQKLFTWFSLGSDERQRKVVYTYMISFGSDLSALAEQLFDSYGVAIRNS